MTALSIQPTFPTFTGADGQPLENGYIWVGTANLNPITNPITVYWDAALSAPATQPIRTLGGYPSNSGTPARLYVNSDYSIQVLDRKGSVVYSAPVATDRYGGGIINANIVVYDPSGTGAVATTVQAKLRERISLLDFYANGVSGVAVDPTGVVDSTGGFQAALDSLSDGDTLILPTGYVLFSSVSTTKAIRIVGPGFTNKLQAVFGDAGWSNRANFGGCVLISTATSGNAISLGTAATNNTLQLENFMLVGPGSGTSTGVELLRSVGNCVRNVLATNFARGFALDQCQDGLYEKIAAKGCKTGVNLAGTITSGQNVFVNPEIQSFDTYGMHVSVASMIAVYGGLVQDGRGGYGIYCDATTSSKNIFDGIWFENANVAGAHPTAAVALFSARNTVRNCYFADPYDTILVSGADADRNKISNNNFGSIATSITVAAGATNTLIIDSEPASGGTISDSGTNTIRITTDSGAVSQKSGNASWSGTASFGGVATAAGTDTKILKKKTGLADAAFTSLASVNVPNSAISASLKIRVTGSLGAGGAIGANESSATIECDVTIARTAGLTCVVTQSASYGSAAAAVAGAATCTVAIDSSLIAGAAGAVQTIIIRVAVTRGSGASTNHTATASIECLNMNDSGVLVY